MIYGENGAMSSLTVDTDKIVSEFLESVYTPKWKDIHKEPPKSKENIIGHLGWESGFPVISVCKFSLGKWHSTAYPNRDVLFWTLLPIDVQNLNDDSKESADARFDRLEKMIKAQNKIIAELTKRIDKPIRHTLFGEGNDSGTP